MGRCVSPEKAGKTPGDAPLQPVWRDSSTSSCTHVYYLQVTNINNVTSNPTSAKKRKKKEEKNKIPFFDNTD